MNKIREAFQRFMYGRYGSDRLNQAMLIVFLVCAMLDIFVDNVYFSVLLTSWEFLFISVCFPEIFQSDMRKIKNIWRWKIRYEDFSGKQNTYSSRERTFIFIHVPSANRKSVFQREKVRLV